jgi:hypothetical protein
VLGTDLVEAPADRGEGGLVGEDLGRLLQRLVLVDRLGSSVGRVTCVPRPGATDVTEVTVTVLEPSTSCACTV